jgi:hypothetical protein
MIKYVLFAAILLFTVTLSAQTNPKIGTEKGVKEKLIRIKNGLPDIKKNLTKRDETFVDEYNVKFEMGNGIVLFNEDEEDHDQSLTIRCTSSYFSGTVADYQNYYKTLVTMIKEVFGPGYEFSTTDKEKSWSTAFFQKGKDVFTSPVRIDIKCDWILESLGPSISIEVWSKVK